MVSISNRSLASVDMSYCLTLQAFVLKAIYFGSFAVVSQYFHLDFLSTRASRAGKQPQSTNQSRRQKTAPMRQLTQVLRHVCFGKCSADKMLSTGVKP